MQAKSDYWPLVIFIFVFHYVLAKGFYNFSFGIAFLFWLIATWLRFLQHKRPVNAAIFFLLSVLTFFAHPIAFAFGCITCFALTVSYILAGAVPAMQGKMKSLMGSITVLILCLLPCGLLAICFGRREGGEGIHLHLHGTRIGTLADLDCLVNLTSTEALPLKIISVFLFTLLLCAVVWRHRKGFNFHKYDGLFFTLLFAGVLSMIFPDSLFGGSLFIIRLQFIIALFSVCCISYTVQAEKIKNIAGVLLFACFAGLSFIRMDRREATSAGVSDLLSASKYIKPYSVLLPLDFSPGGMDKYGKDITNRNWLFCHAAQYLGAEKPLIILDNYEAAMGYFPLTWKSDVNPYAHLCTGGQMEAQPPYATIAGYKSKTGVTIDYILIWCYDPGWLWDENFSKLYAEINAGYHVIYTSATGHTILFEQNRKP